MTAGDHDAGSGLQLVSRKVQKWRRHQADTDYVQTPVAKPAGERRFKTRAGEPAVSTDHSGTMLLSKGFSRKAAANPVHHFFGQIFSRDASNVVSAKNASIDGGVWRSLVHGAVSLLNVCQWCNSKFDFCSEEFNHLLHKLLSDGCFRLFAKVDFSTFVNKRHLIVAAVEPNASIRDVVHHNGV